MAAPETRYKRWERLLDWRLAAAAAVDSAVTRRRGVADACTRVLRLLRQECRTQPSKELLEEPLAPRGVDELGTAGSRVEKILMEHLGVSVVDL